MSASTDTRKKDRLPVPPPKAAKQQPESKAQRMAKVVATVTPKSDPGTQSTATPQATSAILGPTAEKPEAQVTPAPEAGKAAVDGPDLTSVTLGQATASAPRMRSR